MAKNLTYSIKIRVDGRDIEVSTRDVQKFSKAMSDVRTNAQRFNDIGFAFQGLQHSLGQLTNTVSTFTAAFAVQERSELQLANAMRNTMQASAEQVQSIKGLTSAQQSLGVVGDEVQLSGAAVLSTFLRNTEALKILIPAMNDMAVAQDGLNVSQSTTESIAQLFGKAMQGDTDILKRFMLRSIIGRVKRGETIKEVWLRNEDGTMKLLYKNTDG